MSSNSSTMILSCKCLNVQIDTEDQPKTFDKRMLEANYQSPFFFGELLICEPFVVTKRQECFIEQFQDVSGWVINKCSNCNLHCYAELVNKNNPTILINTDLLTVSEQIEKLRNSHGYRYSKTYKIYLNWTHNSDKIYLHRPEVLMLPREKELYRQLNERFEKKTRLVEERISSYTDDIYNDCDERKNKAKNEYHSLKRMFLKTTISNSFVNFPIRHNNKKSSRKLLPTTIKLPIPDVTQLKNNAATSSLINVKSLILDSENNVPIKTSRRLLGGRSNNNGLHPAPYDADLLFCLDDIDNQKTDSDDDKLEAEGNSRNHNKAIAILNHKRRAMASPQPIDKPDVSVIYRDCDSNDDNASGKKRDIGARIIAISKNLFGERVFGD